MKRGKKVGFAVMGLGAIARVAVLPAFRHAKHAKLVALVSRDKRKAQNLARKFKASAAYSVEELDACLANPQVSAVYLATPQSEHLRDTIAAARAGKHVLSEKPLALNSAQSAEMIQVCAEHGVQLMTAYRKYYEPSTIFLKNLIRSGRFGCAFSARLISSAHSTGSSGLPRKTRAIPSPVGLLIRLPTASASRNCSVCRTI